MGVVLLEPDQQALLVETTPDVFSPVRGDWGRRGGTRVNLAAVDQARLKRALGMAWKKRAPKALLRQTDDGKAARKPADTSSASLDRAFARARKAAKATKLPGIEEATSYGTPSLTVHGKLMLRVKDADTLVLRCTLEDKAMLIEAAPTIYFETDHYAGWPAVLGPPLGDRRRRACASPGASLAPAGAEKTQGRIRQCVSGPDKIRSTKKKVAKKEDREEKT